LVAYVRDRICETSTSIGTGNFTLAGAVAGFQTFSAGGVASGTGDFYYLIEAVDGNGNPTGEWEAGIGVCPTSTSLQRLAVLDGSSGLNTPVSFAAGTKRVHVTAPGYQLRWVGAVASLSADLTAQNLTTSTALAWGGTNPDIDASFGVTAPGTGLGFYDGAHPSRITVPSVGYDTALLDVCGQVSLANITVGDWVELKLRLTGATIVGRQTFYIAKTTPALQVRSPQPVTVNASDYIELMVQVGADTSVDVLSADTFLTIDVRQ
jgi:hypothetical protein